MENQGTQVVDNSTVDGATNAGIVNDTTSSATQVTVNTPAGWKAGLRTDLKDSPLLQKFEDTTEGLNKALESHANLEKLLGYEKVPLPKGPEDSEGWSRLSKALGVPDKPDGYKLSDVSLPESMKGMTIDKKQFADVVHANKLTPSAADGLWKAYNEVNIKAYNDHMAAQQKQLNETVNALKNEWGDKFNTNVELGQNVINQFSGDKESNDYITTVLTKDPRGIKFLAKIGEQFSENKVGDFNVKRFAVSPDEAQAEIDKMTRDLEGPYMNTKGKFTEAEHQAAVARRDALQASINRAKG